MTDNESGLIEKKEVNIIKRSSKSNSRPSSKKGFLRRALVTFKIEDKVCRQAVDLIYSENLRRPRILEFSSRNSKTAKFARFYLPEKISDNEVLELVEFWFQQLKIAEKFNVDLA